MSVEIENASINSVQVSINVVKIGQKQMTQAVFNQLYEEKPWDDYYNITEFLWGKVKHKGTDYIVFQSENELRKYEIPRKVKVPDFIYYFRVSAAPKLDKDKLLMASHNTGLAENLRFSCEKVRNEARKTELPHILNQKVGESVSLKDFEAVMEGNCYQQTVEEAKAKKWWDEKRNSLAEELNSQKQLFIAV